MTQGGIASERWRVGERKRNRRRVSGSHRSCFMRVGRPSWDVGGTTGGGGGGGGGAAGDRAFPMAYNTARAPPANASIVGALRVIGRTLRVPCFFPLPRGVPWACELHGPCGWRVLCWSCG